MTGIVNLGYQIYFVFLDIWDWLFTQNEISLDLDGGVFHSVIHGFQNAFSDPLNFFAAFMAGYAEDQINGNFAITYRPIDIALSLITVVVVAKFVKLLWDALPFT